MMHLLRFLNRKVSSKRGRLRALILLLVIVSCLSWLLLFKAHQSQQGSSSPNTGKGDDETARARVVKEKLALAVMNAFSTFPFAVDEDVTSVSEDGDEPTIVLYLHPAPRRRLSLTRFRNGTSTVNSLLAFAVDFVAGSHDRIVPISSLRRISSEDVRLFTSRLGKSKNLPSEGELVAMKERPGGIYKVESSTDTCSGTYTCSEVYYDPLMDSEVCDFRDGRGTRLSTTQVDHLFVLDFLLFGGGGKRNSRQCSVVPNRLGEGSLLLGSSFGECCCDAIEQADVDIERICSVNMNIISRFANFNLRDTINYRGKTIGTAVKAFLLEANGLPDIVRQELLSKLECVDQFVRSVDARLERLFSIIEKDCPEREDIAY